LVGTNDATDAAAPPTRSNSRRSRPTPDYKTSMITDEDPLRGLLFYRDLGFSHTLHVRRWQEQLAQIQVNVTAAGAGGGAVLGVLEALLGKARAMLVRIQVPTPSPQNGESESPFPCLLASVHPLRFPFDTPSSWCTPDSQSRKSIRCAGSTLPGNLLTMISQLTQGTISWPAVHSSRLGINPM